MTEPLGRQRRVARIDDDRAYRPFDRYGQPIPGMAWLNLSYDRATGQGTFVLRMEPGARSMPHEHTEGEEFLMLDGELVDADGTVFRAGDYVAFRPGSRHFSVAPGGCRLIAFMRGPNRPLDADEVEALEAAGSAPAPRTSV